MATILLYWTVIALSGFLAWLFFGPRKLYVQLQHRLESILPMTDSQAEFLSVGVIVIPVVVLLTLRYGVGTDFWNYHTMFVDYTQYGYANDEAGLLALFNIADFLGMGYNGFLFLASTITMMVAAWELRCMCTDESYPFAICIYLCLFFGPMCNIMAQTIAVSFLLVAYNQILKKKPVWFLVCCLCAAMFHTMAIVAIPLYWIYHYALPKYPYHICLGLLGVSLLVGFFPNVLLIFQNVPVVGRYVGYLSQAPIGTWRYTMIYRLPIYAVELFFCGHLLKRTKEGKLYYFIVLLEICSLFIGFGISWGGRLAYFFAIAHVAIASLLIRERKKLVLGRLVKLGLVVYYLALFTMVHFYSNFDEIMVYQLGICK